MTGTDRLALALLIVSLVASGLAYGRMTPAERVAAERYFGGCGR